jgi:hypothetical protein
MTTDKIIRHVEPLDPLAADLVSQPTRELERRLELLENALAHLSKQGSVTNIIIKGKAVASDVELYNTVYYNATSGLYERTLAKVEFTGDKFNTLASSLVTGIVIKKVGTVADILVDGAWPIATMLDSNNLLEPGEQFLPGRPYYLSSSHYGRITSRPPNIAIQVSLMSDTDIIMSKVYGNSDGFESSAKFPMGMRPIGSILNDNGTHRIVGFHGLESADGSTNWASTTDSTNYSISGYMVAEGTALGFVDGEVWIDLTIATNGEITGKLASSLENLSNGVADLGEQTWWDDTVNSEYPYKVTSQNYGSVRNLTLNNSAGNPVYKISFKFVHNDDGSFDFNKHRSLLFRIPESFQGWKEIDASDIDNNQADPYKYQIQPYYSEAVDSDYPDYGFVPDSAEAPLYYDTKADFGFVRNWPPSPLDRAVVVMNGVELDTTALVETAQPTFETEFLNVGSSAKTLYWGNKFSSTQPWSSSYQSVLDATDGTHNEPAKLGHRPSATGYWYWTESTYAYEPHRNIGWVHSNKISVFNSSNKVLGLGVMSPLKVRDSITGREPTYEGEPIGGNLVLWSDDKDTIVNRTNGISLSSLGRTGIYTNTSNFTVAVKDLLVIVTSQDGAQLSNDELGVSRSVENAAKVNLGTGTVGTGVYNLAENKSTNAYEYGNSSVVVLENAKVVHPGETVYLSVATAFPAEQTVSIILTGRVI